MTIINVTWSPQGPRSRLLKQKMRFWPSCMVPHLPFTSIRGIMTSSNGHISALLALCARNLPVTGEFPSQRPVTRSFDVFPYLRLSKRLSKQSWGWWFEMLSRPLWRHCNLFIKKFIPRRTSFLQTTYFNNLFMIKSYIAFKNSDGVLSIAGQLQCKLQTVLLICV